MKQFINKFSKIVVKFKIHSFIGILFCITMLCLNSLFIWNCIKTTTYYLFSPYENEGIANVTILGIY